MREVELTRAQSSSIDISLMVKAGKLQGLQISTVIIIIPASSSEKWSQADAATDHEGGRAP